MFHEIVWKKYFTVYPRLKKTIGEVFWRKWRPWDWTLKWRYVWNSLLLYSYHWISMNCNKGFIYGTNFDNDYYCYYFHHYYCFCRFYYSVVFIVAVSVILLVFFFRGLEWKIKGGCGGRIRDLNEKTVWTK